MATLHICISLLLVLQRTPTDQGRESTRQFRESEKVIRGIVYNNNVILYTPMDGPYEFVEIVRVPKELVKAYKAYPSQVMDLLLSISEGGRPKDSITAIAYLTALVCDPVSAKACVVVFDEKVYDDTDVDWGRSPRHHWLAKLNTAIAEKGRKGEGIIPPSVPFMPPPQPLPNSRP